eukprot:Skav217490  [mRNA]  locus=scaffold3428:61394:63287:- [translate_table: standard]
MRSAEHSAYNEVSARLACVLEEIPDLWQELKEELMQSIWLGSDAAVQSRLAEGAAGCLLTPDSERQPQNLAELLCLVGRALAEESRYCAAFALVQKAHHLANAANAVGSRDLTLSTLLDLRSRALPSWHFHMLNDRPRNRGFATAIEDGLKQLSANRHASEQHLTCLDIGTGTGLLALICWQLGHELPNSRSLTVHACEQNEVQLHLANSQDLQLPPADLVFCEACEGVSERKKRKRDEDRKEKK